MGTEIQTLEQPVSPPGTYGTAERLEQYLADPWDPESAFSFQRAVEQDERDEYPEEACRLLYEWGFHHHLIPREYGGKFRSYEELLSLTRVVARRDLTVAVALGQVYLGAVAVWIEGSEAQKCRLAELIRGQEQACLALTEEAHGSDVLANEVRATRAAGGYLLSGKKWLINNATRGRVVTVFARTDPDGGPRGFSLFLVDKDGLAEGSYAPLPKKKTLGVRGADISGICFDGCLVPDGAMIGPPGAGLELALRCLQISRTICAGFSLGAADTALRATLDFALSRRLYGDTVIAIPHARGALVDCFLDLLICDCTAIAAARALHAATGQLGLWSAVVKYFVPTTAEDLIRTLSVLLGARYYLREGHAGGVFQKVLRDNAVVSLFDGSTVVNLNAIGLELRNLARIAHGGG
jgi:alkylation response protein AidB-like acyl-CoA dehydrogenase